MPAPSPAVVNREQAHLVGDPAPFHAELIVRSIEDGIQQATLILTCSQAAVPPPLTLEWFQPLIDTAAVWTTAAGRDKGLTPNWARGAPAAKATSQAPVACLISPAGTNRLCFACSDALHQSRLTAGVIEETGEVQCAVELFADRRAPSRRIEVVVRIDRRGVGYERALADVAQWWAQQPGYQPSPVPEAARLPMYSTWYSFHQQLDPARVEEQCRLAKAMGCAAVIVDDGWQTSDGSRGYAYCGDWEPVRIPALAEHVKRVQALGMQFILWYSVPFVGIHSHAFARFRKRLLRIDERMGAGVLDPRYPEVREFIIGTYERALREWGLDGFKLDFVDSFHGDAATPADAADGRDYASVDEAVDRLLGEVMGRLRKLKSEVMIEFRQSYIGPLMRKYGNLFRAGDCPADHVRNRVATIDIRLLCGATACHADMLMWHPDEPVESAALQLLAVLFSVPQISVLLDRFPKEQVAMVRFWLGFWRSHRDALLDGDLRAVSPELNYPLVTARTARKSIVALYADAVAPVGGAAECHIVNATRAARVVIEVERDLGERSVRVCDCQGTVVREERQRFAAGVHRLAVPPAGLISISV